MTKKKDEPRTEPSPWQKGTSVKGIVPPGRRLANEKRKTRWSASGVKGVTPPGKLKADEGPAVDWADKVDKERTKRAKENQRALDQAKVKPGEKPEVDPMRPVGGFVPHPFADLGDPTDMKSFLRLINEYLDKEKPSADLAEGFGSLITQSHAPFDVVVGFTILSALIGKSTQLRRRYAVPLERGAKVYFNLVGRLEKNVQVPRGLVPETVNAMFFDLPQAAYQVPFAYSTHAFLKMLELLRDPSGDSDEALLALGDQLHARFIAGRSLGDEPLSRMFPFERPEW